MVFTIIMVQQSNGITDLNMRYIYTHIYYNMYVYI